MIFRPHWQINFKQRQQEAWLMSQKHSQNAIALAMPTGADRSSERFCVPEKMLLRMQHIGCLRHSPPSTQRLLSCAPDGLVGIPAHCLM
jgi:hypothetical protein